MTRFPATTEPDVIVVGGGAAGCVLAARLSDDPRCTVLLIEAGADATPMASKVPAAFPKLIGTAADWNLHTVPQPHLGGRRLRWPRGRLVGGSAAINAQMWIHPSAGDLDRWHQLTSGGLDREQVRSALQRVSATVGPSQLRDPSDFSSMFVVGAGERLGLRITADVNDPIGGDRVGPTPVTQRNGARFSARQAYLDPVVRRPNLRVVAGVEVDRLLLDGTRVVGVEVVEAGGRRRIVARRGVVLAAGTIGSPAILQRSGFGDPDHLRSVGVEPVADLPAVGAHLQDHLMSIVVAATDGDVPTLKNATRPSQLARYLTVRRGMLASNVAEATSFLRSRPSVRGSDLQFIFAPVMFLDHGQTAPPRHGISIGVVLLRPESSGVVQIVGPDPAQPPAIDPRYLSEGADRVALASGVERAIEVLQASPVDRHVTGLVEPGTPGVDAIDHHLVSRAETVYHPVGTCRMGLEASDSVVDVGFAVHGTSGLWVADASVMPSITEGNTLAPTLVLAELAAERIAAEAGRAVRITP